ncbi:hypothetical protein [Gimesia panareensis]|uniref:hypothetical protein n=1 Tax=Gimesia panareensis TaxID=2527978 RepID=UPI00118ABEF1|nr:hypothetical protein [Gimesia panareensis]QDU52979.1 hypothetical protein Pan110_53610 [Gimesia panareensis]
MNAKDVNFVRLLQVFGANIGVIVLAFIGLVVGINFTKLPFFIMLFIISILQGGLMVRAFGPAVNSEEKLSLGGKIIGWSGLVGWLLIHLLNAVITYAQSVQSGFWATVIELSVYLTVNTFTLFPFYKGIFKGRKVNSDRNQTAIGNNKEEAEIQLREEQERREKARFDCQLLYDRNAGRLQNYFPKEKLADYHERHLSDSFPAEIVEKRAKQLEEMLHSFLVDTDGKHQQFTSLNEIAAYFQKQKQEIESLQYDEQTRQTIISSLNEQEDRTIREFLSS